MTITIGIWLLIGLELLIAGAAVYLFKKLIKEDNRILNAHKDKIQRSMDYSDLSQEDIVVEYSEYPFVELY